MQGGRGWKERGLDGHGTKTLSSLNMGSEKFKLNPASELTLVLRYGPVLVPKF